MSKVMQGEGSHEVVLVVEETGGRGLSVSLFGGDAHHVGGVAVAVPRPKSNAPGLTCDISQICLPGHKDVYAAVEVAKYLALASEQTVAVTCGIHMDDASSDDVAQLMDNALACAQVWLESHGA